jgi:hypothetical protein
MDGKDVTDDQLNALIDEKRKLRDKVKVNDITYLDVYSANPIIDALVAFHDLPELQKGLKEKFKDNNLELGD